jgi:uroporphyrin-III C-methyltransferase
LAAAAAQGVTLVIYMGISTLESLQAGLLQGLAAQTPAAVIQHASLPTQRHIQSTLGDLAATVQRENIGSPAIIIVGDVLRAANCLELGVPESRAA